MMLANGMPGVHRGEPITAEGMNLSLEMALTKIDVSYPLVMEHLGGMVRIAMDPQYGDAEPDITLEAGSCIEVEYDEEGVWTIAFDTVVASTTTLTPKVVTEITSLTVVSSTTLRISYKDADIQVQENACGVVLGVALANETARTKDLLGTACP